MEKNRSYISLRLKPVRNKQIRSCQLISDKEIQMNDEKNQIYRFDDIFQESDDNQKIFDRMGKQILEKFLNGDNCMICVHGQTSSGKTHTMNGQKNQEGIIQLSTNYILNSKNYQNMQGKLLMECYEIYNESLNDLLCLEENQPKLKYNTNYRSVQIYTMEQFRDHYQQCDGRRHYNSTSMNQQSSRGHLFLKLRLEQKQEDQLIESQFLFLDLAGQESILQDLQVSASKQQLRNQSVKINQSLLAFTNLINQKVQNQGIIENQSCFINYRDSLLSYHLKPVLKENCTLGFIFTINLESCYSQQTLQTLKLAKKIGTIKYQTNQINNKSNMEKDQDYKLELQQLQQKYESLSLENENMKQKWINHEEKFIIQEEKLKKQEERFIIQEEKFKNQEEKFIIQEEKFKNQEQNQINQEEKINNLEKYLLDQKREQFNQRIQKENRNGFINSKRQQIQQNIVEEQKLDFNYSQDHFARLSNIGIKSFHREFKTYPQKKYQNKKFMVLISEHKDLLLLKNKVEQIFNYNIGSFIILGNDKEQFFFIIQFQQSIDYKLSLITKQTDYFIIIDKEIEINNIKFMLQIFDVKYCLQNIINEQIKNQENFLKKVVFCQSIEYEYIDVNEDEFKDISLLIENLNMKRYDHLVQIKQYTIRFIIRLENSQNVLINDYLSQIHKPKINVIDKKYTFNQIQQFYFNKYQEDLYVVKNNKFNRIQNIKIEEVEQVVNIYE